jgi:C2 domain
MVDPKWNETFSAQVPLDDLDQEEAAFESTLMDRDMENEDDLLGKVTVPIPPVITQVTLDSATAGSSQWYCTIFPQTLPTKLEESGMQVVRILAHHQATSQGLLIIARVTEWLRSRVHIKHCAPHCLLASEYMN